MPATSITYSSAVSKSLKVESIYLDTSFIYDVLISISTPHFSKPQIKPTKIFYDYLSNNNIEMWTSYLAVQELMFKQFNIELLKEIRNFEKGNGLPPNSLNYNLFKRNHKKDFQNIYKKHKQIFENTFRAVISLKIKIKIPKDYPIVHSSSKGERIVRYAKCLLDKYFLEVADAFHRDCLTNCVSSIFTVSYPQTI
ncbi:MAG: hypothetical protein HZB61_12735 [Nitrospirae bacterium]|nr:hypothetical protein [Nitrospirota bacterium]